MGTAKPSPIKQTRKEGSITCAKHRKEKKAKERRREQIVAVLTEVTLVLTSIYYLLEIVNRCTEFF